MVKNKNTKTFTIKLARVNDSPTTLMFSDEELISLILEKGGMLSVSSVKEND
jgi:hypothetical protein